MLYKTLCAPIYDYCDIIYDSLSQKNISRLQKLQNGALRIVALADRFTHSADLHTMFKMDTLVNRCHKHCCHYAYKAYHDMCPESFCSLFKPVSLRDCSIFTHSATQLTVEIPMFRLELTRKSYSFRGQTLWNFLDLDIKIATSFNQFKRLLNESDMFV